MGLVSLLSGIESFTKMKIKIKNAINHPKEDSIKLLLISFHLIYRTLSYFIYKLVFNNFSHTSYIHYFASLCFLGFDPFILPLYVVINLLLNHENRKRSVRWEV